MFVRHQKASAPWPCSIWPNMERKNAAFSRNQTGKKKGGAGGGCLACCVHSEIELSHSPHSGHTVGSLSKQHDWWWCWTRRGISADVVGAHRPQRATPARAQEPWKGEAHGPFLYADISFLKKNKHTKAFSTVRHTRSAAAQCSRTPGLSTPRGDIPRRGKSSRLKRHSLVL